MPCIQERKRYVTDCMRVDTAGHYYTLIFQIPPEVWCFKYVFGLQSYLQPQGVWKPIGIAPFFLKNTHCSVGFAIFSKPKGP